MKNWKSLSCILVLISILLLIPGLTMPIFKLQMKTTIASRIGEFESVGLDKNRSVIGTVKDLYEDNRLLVSGLILLFSIIVPFLKAILLFKSIFSKDNLLRRKLFNFVNTIGKWSMADVFVVAILLSYLSLTGQGSEKSFEVTYLGMVIPVSIKTEFISGLGIGFYFFLGYCLVSIASLHVMKNFIEQQE